MNMLEIMPGINVKCYFKDSQIIEGEVYTFESSANTECGLYELTVIPFEGQQKGRHVVFDETEVERIEILD